MGSRKGAGSRGRPHNTPTAAAKASFSSEYSNIDISSVPAWSHSKAVFKSSCKCYKHFRYLSCQRTARCNRSLACRICQGKGSSLEKLLYSILNKSAAVHAYAVEAYAVQGQNQHEGENVQLNRHPWDAALLQPAQLLIEVQGEQHSTKLLTKAGCTDISLSSRSSRDEALRAGAVQQGFYVLWLLPGEERGRHQRSSWTRAIHAMLQKVKDKVPAFHDWA